MSFRHERHECETIGTRATRVGYECYTNDTSATRVKNFDFDNDKSKKIFLEPYISYMANERLLSIWQMKYYNERNNFILITTFWKCLVPIPKCV